MAALGGPAACKRFLRVPHCGTPTKQHRLPTKTHHHHRYCGVVQINWDGAQSRRCGGFSVSRIVGPGGIKEPLPEPTLCQLDVSTKVGSGNRASGNWGCNRRPRAQRCVASSSHQSPFAIWAQVLSCPNVLFSKSQGERWQRYESKNRVEEIRGELR